MASADSFRRPIEHLARLDRESCSAGEREAADWIAHALEERGAAVEVDQERVHGTYWWPLGITSALGIAAALSAQRKYRLRGFALGAVGCALVIDDLGAGARWLRRLLPKKPTANVVGQIGPDTAPRTVVLVAHHDAAHSGFFFNPRIERALGRLLGGRRERPARVPGLMLPIAAGPAVAGVGALVGWRRMAGLGGLLCAGIIGSFLDIALRDTVPGANDNLSGVSTLLAVAEGLRDNPTEGVRVLLVSTGAEESLMEGMRAFAERRFPGLARNRTQVIAVDSVGSPRLVLAEAEGMLQVRPYDDALKQLISRCAQDLGIELLRGLTMRFGTDGYLALRHGYRAALVMSVDSSGTASNYHWPTDTPDRVEYETVASAARLCELVIRRLGDAPTRESLRAPVLPPERAALST